MGEPTSTIFFNPKLYYLQIKVNLLEILKLVDIMSAYSALNSGI